MTYREFVSDLKKNQDQEQANTTMKDFNDFQKVVDNLFIGNQISASKFNSLKEHNIKLVFFANGGFKTSKRGDTNKPVKSMFSDIDHYSMNLEDHSDFEISSYFDTACEVIHSYKSQGKAVLVVCTAGVSRSATIVIAYLIKHLNMSHDEALKLVKEKRRFIKPNNGFIEQLK